MVRRDKVIHSVCKTRDKKSIGGNIIVCLHMRKKIFLFYNTNIPFHYGEIHFHRGVVDAPMRMNGRSNFFSARYENFKVKNKNFIF